MKDRNPLFDPDVDGNTLAWLADKKRHQEDEDDDNLTSSERS